MVVCPSNFESTAKVLASALSSLADPPANAEADKKSPTLDRSAESYKTVQILGAVMRDVPDGRRAAHFVCVLILVAPGGEERVFEGRCDGRLGREPAGGEGFGYDPLFIPDGYDRTFAELDSAIKNRLSHRGRAWASLSAWLHENAPV